MQENILQEKSWGETNNAFIPMDKDVVAYIVECFANENRDIIFCNDFYVYENGYWKIENPFMIKKRIQYFANEELRLPEKYWKSYKKADDLFSQAKLDMYHEIETNKDVLNFPNGSLELSTMKFRQHRKSDFLFYVLPYEYDEKAKCPMFEKFLDEILPQRDLQTIIQEAVAYPLSGLHLEKVSLLYGSGRNGKSVLLEVVANILGKENVSNVPLANITKNDGLSMQQMEGKLINISYENSPKVFETSIMKSYVSQEAMNVKKLYKDSYTTTNYPQTIMAANSLPQSDDYSYGFYRRLLPIPFDVTISADKVNPNLKNELLTEAGGILNWILEGVHRLRKQNSFSTSPTIEALLQEYRTQSDVVSLFLDEKYYTSSNDKKDLLINLYREFDLFVSSNGYKTISNRTFAQRLRGLGYRVEKKGGGQIYVYFQIKRSE